MPAQPTWEYESRYEGIMMNEAEGIVEEFEEKLGEAIEVIEGLNDSYLEAYVINKLRASGEGDMFGSLADIARQHILSDD